MKILTHEKSITQMVILILQEKSTNPSNGIMITDNAAAPSQPPRIVGIKLQFPLNSFHLFLFLFFFENQLLSI